MNNTSIANDIFLVYQWRNKISNFSTGWISIGISVAGFSVLAERYIPFYVE